ncbi:hypothetical protein CVT24_013099 [Panaeolus cyanescens]|uniref:G-protein coupled receptors family 1 profile domain-containing protein n=1 Tax=Panaeolus cyanescens TaxID=181874 RepID=A0A409YN72_9AGAR|nr:hypothetical protein CVT24_013099 [Panaeolus cyanescens]
MAATLSTELLLHDTFSPEEFIIASKTSSYEVTVSIYILVGTCAITVWDVIHNLKADYKLAFKYKFGLPTIVYFISRLATMAYIITSTIFVTAPIGNCSYFDTVVNWMFPISVPATSLLFFFRIRAVFDDDPFVVSFFGFMWFAVLGGSLTVTQGVHAASIAGTQYCAAGPYEDYVASATILPLIHDTLIFLAISWRLIANSHVDHNFRNGYRVMVFGDYLPAFSKSLLQGGQAYYLTTVTSSLLTVIMLEVDAVPPVFRSIFTVSNVMLMNIMACRVYRNTKFGLFASDDEEDHVIIGRTGSGNRASMTVIRRNPRHVKSIDRDRLDLRKIEIAKTVHHISDYPLEERVSRATSNTHVEEV